MKTSVSQIFTLIMVFILTACAPAQTLSTPIMARTTTALPSPAPTDIPTPAATTTATPSLTSTPTPTVKPTETATQPSIQSEGRQGIISFVMVQGNMGGIHAIQADGSSDPVILSLHPSIDGKPSWSPDGSKIAFESFRDDPDSRQHLDIYSMNFDGSQFTRLTNADAVYQQPDWSPDGSRIALSSNKEDADNYDLYVLELNSEQLTRVTDDPAADTEPSWSPDESQLAFVSDRDGLSNIYIVNLDSRETMQLTKGNGNNTHPDWSPDGKKILFDSDRDGDEEIYVMDADGTNQTRLTTAPGRDIDPEWSPGGNYIAYCHEEEKARKVYIMDSKGSSPEPLFEIPEGAIAGYPAWSSAQLKINESPIIGPPFCMRDTDGDFEPDVVSTTFSTDDLIAYIVFPYDNMQDGMKYEHTWKFPGNLPISLNNFESWEGGEEGFHFSYSALQNTPGMVTVKLSLNGKMVQQISCEVVQP
jgi:TolB protein